MPRKKAMAKAAAKAKGTKPRKRKTRAKRVRRSYAGQAMDYLMEAPQQLQKSVLQLLKSFRKHQQ